MPGPPGDGGKVGEPGAPGEAGKTGRPGPNVMKIFHQSKHLNH